MYWLKSEITADDRNERVRAVLDITNQLSNKFRVLGIKRKSIITAAADLGDIYQYANDIRELIDLILKIPPDEMDELASAFLNLRIILGEIKDHNVHARLPLDYLADYCEDIHHQKMEDLNKNTEPT